MMMNKELDELKAQLPPLRKEKPLAYNIYTDLKTNARGYKNRVKADVLMSEFGITDNKTLRSYIQEIRESETLQKIICSEAGSDGGYWVAANQKEVSKTLEHLYKRAIEMLKNYSILRNKARLNGQKRIKLTKYQKDCIESILGSEEK